MTVTAKIKHDTIQVTADSKGKWQSATVPYVITGVDETLQEEQVVEILRTTAPRRFQGLPLDTIQVTKMHLLDCYEGEVTYQHNKNNPTQSEDKTPLEAQASGTLVDMSIEFVSSSINVVQSHGRSQTIISDRAIAEGTGTHEEADGLLINQQEDGTAMGVDVYTTDIVYTETHELPNSQITEAYVATVFSLQNCVNASKFRYFEIGEALFKGASFRRNVKNGTWNVTFEFAGRKNQTNVTLPGFSDSFPDVTGWNYIWTYTRKTTGTMNDETCIDAYPIYAMLENPYLPADFSALGINA